MDEVARTSSDDHKFVAWSGTPRELRRMAVCLSCGVPYTTHGPTAIPKEERAKVIELVADYESVPQRRCYPALE